MCLGRKARTDVGPTTTHIRRSTGRMASTPSGGFPPSPAQAGRARSTCWSGDRSIAWLCSWIVTGCRSRREPPGPSQPPRRATVAESVGSSLPSLVLGRRKGAHPSREGVLVSAKRPSLTRRQRRRCLAGSPRRSGRKALDRRAWSRQRASEATSQARHAVDNAAVGRCSAEEHSIEAPPGPRSITLIGAIERSG